jgi:cysteine synthase A
MEEILNLIGNTPLLNIEENIYAKMEGFNLTGSIKDRTALAMVEAAEKDNQLIPGSRIIESTSGNTGIALAMISAVKGYDLSVVLPASTTEEKKKMILTYGARIITVPDKKPRNEIIEELKEQNNFVFLNQYENINNIKTHYEKTGQEIINQLNQPIDYFVAGIGTGGTITGISKKIKDHFPNAKIIGVEPAEGERIEGLRSIKDGFIPPVLEVNIINEIIDLTEDDAIKGRNALAKKGILVGLSSGAAYQAIKNLNLKGNIVTIFPDRGERYLK